MEKEKDGIDPNTIWLIGKGDYYLEPINIGDGKNLLKKYNNQSITLIQTIDELYISSFLDRHYYHPGCDKNKFINNLKIHFVNAKYNHEGRESYKLYEETRIAINLWIEKVNNNFIISLNEIATKEAVLANKEAALAEREAKLIKSEKELSGNKILEVLNNLSIKEVLNIINKLSPKLGIEIIKRLSPAELEQKQAETKLDLQSFILLADSLRTHGIIAKLFNKKLGFHLEHLTGYSREMYRRGFSNKNDIMVEDISKEGGKIDTIIYLLKDVINTFEKDKQGVIRIKKK